MHQTQQPTGFPYRVHWQNRATGQWGYGAPCKDIAEANGIMATLAANCPGWEHFVSDAQVEHPQGIARA